MEVMEVFRGYRRDTEVTELYRDYRQGDRDYRDLLGDAVKCRVKRIY